MKLSNLASRMEPETEQEAAEAPAAAPSTEGDTRALGLEYRAIVIRDDGLRPFRVR